MPFELNRHHIGRIALVREMFIDTADHNYVIARWCYVQNLDTDFLWLAAHALEKYMKAALLLNGESCAQSGHEIPNLFKKLHEIASDLLPITLSQPEAIVTLIWFEETPISFLTRIHKKGGPSSRYGMNPASCFSQDLYKLDQMVFAVRRLCAMLDAYRFKARMGCSNRDVLLANPRDWRLSRGKLEDIAEGKCGELLRCAFLDGNIPFAPPDHEHNPIPDKANYYAVALNRNVLSPLQDYPGSDSAREAAALCDWALQNIRISKPLLSKMKAARKVHENTLHSD